MIYFENVSKIYNAISVALENITFSVEPKEFVSLVGQSGAGKTTLIKLLLAEEYPTEGSVFFESLDVHRLLSEELPMVRRRMGTIFQDFKLLPAKTAYENIAFAMEASGRTNEEIASDVPQILELVGLSDKADNFPHELSGGEKQRVSIARALINRPDVIIADEPTGNLDPLNAWEIVRLLGKINDLGTTVLLATHDKDVINAIGKRVVTMEKGKIIRDEKKGRYVL
ncbi:MAG: cell division ATP-binding protein FtsE [Candidatus Ryanbacteria bacterium RIFCSPHIGHO2_02_FULL_45_43]|uniref:Cell division ATP-binding protein FtsE n=1 Tax=Candidatus Ryanbacteria bacterium RIFCSPHIGHO2_01_45_13 TaxID=1802112 RepID=A0A1G2G1Q4_9BACT|nr:MAG: cell division ATP-binding protein FtsE [Candidatus Ryanbacteria bacterium RIFCSPHIGHO2_01_FULL_44_130]OGZ43781.1 MAG: cell division ATP-binding protein FtsE [Candidatus Ryanbacteria bacterium RIFCSPHIGHO2_01_45_13]OGZ47723.1 MAG: cell division ATP-binding protein FtsE [Candidatus Ryanbacteria bacterium RIFCSPHIGHO2_02_FULL_45_43]OGZ49619.1 MAG: cell division ATP-binding protein FtsE [Candidatus Ryanbacteria bacterium RIFCSPHIGHO2_12_FULL_44_20]OGZ51301.1 MAG: cell division ATP-binding p